MEDIILIDSNNLKSIVDKLNIYIGDEINIIDQAISSFKSVGESYISANIDLLESIEEQIVFNLKNVKEDHDLNVYAINKRIDNVEEKIKKSKEIDDSAKIDGIM